MKPFDVIGNQVILSLEVSDYAKLAKLLENEFKPEKHKFVVYSFKDIEKAGKYISKYIKSLKVD